MSHVRPLVFQTNTQPEGNSLSATALPDGIRRDQAILKTVLYCDLFDYPLTPVEIAHYLVEAQGSRDEIETALTSSVWLHERISQVEGFVTLRGREDLVERRRQKLAVSHRLWRKARFFARVISRMPFVKMVAVTGALAMDNSGPEDDLDLLIVTSPSRVWLARALAVLVVHVGKLSPNTLCPNYLISEERLGLEPQTIYVAHEFVQMVPLYGHDVYRQMRSANPWISRILPNACRPLHVEAEYRPGRAARKVKQGMERLLSGALGDRLEAWEMRRKIHKFATRAAVSGGSVIFDRNQVKGHFEDHGATIVSRYRGRLEEHHLPFHTGA